VNDAPIVPQVPHQFLTCNSHPSLNQNQGNWTIANFTLQSRITNKISADKKSSFVEYLTWMNMEINWLIQRYNQSKQRNRSNSWTTLHPNKELGFRSPCTITINNAFYLYFTLLVVYVPQLAKAFFVIVDTHKKERAHVICFSFVCSKLISMVGENIYLYKKVQKRKYFWNSKSIYKDWSIIYMSE
jgi:hypothetical protein